MKEFLLSCWGRTKIVKLRTDLGKSGSYVNQSENVPTCEFVKAESTMGLFKWAQSAFFSISCSVLLNNSQSLQRIPKEKDFLCVKIK